MTKKDVIDCFTMASEAVKTVAQELVTIEAPIGPDSVAGLILQLTDRLLQANEMEAQDKRVIPAVVAGADPGFRRLN